MTLVTNNTRHFARVSGIILKTYQAGRGGLGETALHLSEYIDAHYYLICAWYSCRE